MIVLGKQQRILATHVHDYILLQFLHTSLIYTISQAFIDISEYNNYLSELEPWNRVAPDEQCMEINSSKIVASLLAHSVNNLLPYRGPRLDPWSGKSCGEGNGNPF